LSVRSIPVTQFMTERLKAFSTEELSAVIFSLDVAETIEPLTPEADKIRQELIAGLKERGTVKVATRPVN
jgi:hypothetical protein